MIIRKALPSDVSTLYTLEQELFTAENFPLSRRSIVYHIRHNLLYVVEIEGVIAAYALALIQRKDAKLYSLGVKEVYRGQKITLKLLEVILNALQFLGFERTLLEVRIDNYAAIALYKRFGFSIKKQLPAFYKDGCDAYLMEFKQK
jgi:ribosomal-protein-alanine N-acetyltransferase